METDVTPTFSPILLKAIPTLINFPQDHFTVDYDRGADVLYLSFDSPQQATDAVTTDDGIILRYAGDRLIGITVLNASTRA